MIDVADRRALRQAIRTSVLAMRHEIPEHDLLDAVLCRTWWLAREQDERAALDLGWVRTYAQRVYRLAVRD